MPFRHVQYLGCKLTLRPNHFVSRDSVFEFGVLREPAKERGVKFSTAGFDYVV